MGSIQFSTQMLSALRVHEHAGKVDSTEGSLGFVDIDRLPEKGVKPFIIVFPITHIPGAIQHNLYFRNSVNTTIRNIRGKEQFFTLDNCGFETRKWEYNEEWLVDEDTVQQKYLPAAEAFMKEALGSSKVFIFDWLVRKNTPILEDRRFQKQLRPALNVHVDQTPGSAERRVRWHMGDEAEELLKHRHQIVNLWRPTFEPIEDWPLTICDYRTVDPTDAIHADTVGRGPYVVGESAYMQENPAQEFWYMKNQGVEDVWLLKQFDSWAYTKAGEDAKIAAYAPHTAFEDPKAPKNARPRESIELRALVFYDDDNEMGI